MLSSQINFIRIKIVIASYFILNISDSIETSFLQI